MFFLVTSSKLKLYSIWYLSFYLLEFFNRISNHFIIYIFNGIFDPREFVIIPSLSKISLSFNFLVCDNLNYMFSALNANLFFINRSIYRIESTFFIIKKSQFFTYWLFYFFSSCKDIVPFYNIFTISLLSLKISSVHINGIYIRVEPFFVNL